MMVLFAMFDENGNIVYYEELDGYWSKHIFDNNGYEIYHENLDGYWDKFVYDENGKVILS